MRRGHAHDPGPARGIEPLDGPDEVVGLGQGRGRLDEDDGPEPMRRSRPAPRGRGAPRRPTSPSRSRAPPAVRTASRRPRPGRAAAMAGSSVLQTTRCGPPASRAAASRAVRAARPTSGMPPTVTQVLAGDPLAATAGRDQEQDAVRHAVHARRSSAIRSLAEPGSKWASMNACRASGVAAAGRHRGRPAGRPRSGPGSATPAST